MQECVIRRESGTLDLLVVLSENAIKTECINRLHHNKLKTFFKTDFSFRSYSLLPCGCHYKLARTFACSGHCLWPHSGQKRAETEILCSQLGQIFNTSLIRRNAPQKLQYAESEGTCLLQLGQVKYCPDKGRGIRTQAPTFNPSTSI